MLEEKDVDATQTTIYKAFEGSGLNQEEILDILADTETGVRIDRIVIPDEKE